MDRISAALLLAIGGLVIISIIIVCNTWIVGSEEPTEVEAVTSNESANVGLVFNDDTSVTNYENKNLWLRVQVVYGKYQKGNDDKYEIESQALKNGCWTLAEDGWYYYCESLGFSEQTEPLIGRILCNDREVSEEESGGFSLKVEIVDEGLLMQKPRNGTEAFELFKAATPLFGPQYL